MIKRKATLATMLRRIFSVGIFLFLVAVLAIGWAEGRDFSWLLKDEIEARLTQHTGRPVTVEGRIGFELEWTQVRVFTEDVITDVGDGDAAMGASIHADRAGVTVGLWPLLRGKIDLRGLMLREARITLPAPNGPVAQSDGAGAGVGENAEAALAMLNRIRQISIDNLHLIRGRRDQDAQEIDIDHLIVQPENGGLHMAFVGDMEGIPYDVDGHLSSLPDFLRQQGSPATLTASIGPNTVEASGTLTRIWPFEAELEFDGNARDVARLAELFGLSLPGAGAGAMAGHLSIKTGHAVITLTNLTVHHKAGADGAEPGLGIGPVTGTATVTRRDDGRFEVSGMLSSPNVDAEPLFRRSAEDEARPSVADVVEMPLEAGDALADRPIPYERFGRLAGTLELRATAFHYKDAVFENIVVPFSAEGGTFRIDRATGTYNGAPLSLTLVVDSNDQSVHVEAAAHQFNFGTLTDELGGEALVRGPAHIAIEGTGSGATVGDVLGSFTGQSNMMVGEGELERGGIDFLAADLVQAFFADEGRHSTPLHCLVNRIDYEDGVGQSRALLVDTHLITITGSGRINLARNNVNFRLAPRPKDPTLLSLAADYTVEGPILNPTITPDAGDLIRGVATALGSFALTGGAAALLPLFGDGEQIANPCITALTGESPPTDSAPATDDE